MADEKDRKWISGAVKRPGQLHRDLGIPQGDPIPAAALQRALRGDYGEKTRQRAHFAAVMRGLGRD